MTIKNLLKSKIKMIVITSSFNGMLFMRDKITKDEMESKQEQLVVDLYNVISGLEPKQESEYI